MYAERALSSAPLLSGGAPGVLEVWPVLGAIMYDDAPPRAIAIVADHSIRPTHTHTRVTHTYTARCAYIIKQAQHSCLVHAMHSHVFVVIMMPTDRKYV